MIRFRESFEQFGAPHQVALGRAAVARAPESVEGWKLLARSLTRIGDSSAARSAIEQAIRRFPGDGALRELRVREMLASGETAAALEALADSERAASPVSDLLRAEVLSAAGDWDALAQALDRVSPTSANVQSLLRLCAQLALARKAPERLLELCERVLEASPAHSSALYYKSLVFLQLGRREEARAVMAFDAFLAVRDLPPPPGYADGQVFRDALADEVRTNPTLIPDPKGKATERGRQTMWLRRPGAPATAALIVQLKDAVRDYAKRILALPGAFARAMPTDAEFEVWAVVYTSESRQRPHHHASGWLSGVYYVAAPRVPGEQSFRGRLRLGALDRDAAGPVPWNVIPIEPVPGRLVLFPSHVPHDTEPSGLAGERISVAFDVVPCAEECGRP